MKAFLRKRSKLLHTDASNVSYLDRHILGSTVAIISLRRLGYLSHIIGVLVSIPSVVLFCADSKQFLVP